MNEPMTMSELIAATNNAVASLHVDDNRVAAELTERTVRYYVTLGLVRPPVRDGGRSLWTTDHVNDLIRIRRAQSLGQSLKQISSFRQGTALGTWMAANLPRTTREAHDAVHLAAKAEALSAPWGRGAGWSVRISDDITLSGFTEDAPTPEQLDAVRAALASLLGD